MRHARARNASACDTATVCPIWSSSKIVISETEAGTVFEVSYWAEPSFKEQLYSKCRKVFLVPYLIINTNNPQTLNSVS
jgi:hypothetical protein